MRERPLQFGSHGNLYGVLCEPAAGAAWPGAPVVLLSNTGIHHHVGPNRIWVELARALAARGVASLRFDQSGLGDSAPRPGTEGERERAVLDFAEAMAAVEERRGPSTFALVGLCSGADAVHASALADPRVGGVAYVDGFAWRTPGFWLRLPLRKLEARRWRRKLRNLRDRRAATRLGGEAEIFVRDEPPPERLRREVGELLARNVRVLAAYSGGLMNYGYANQFRAMMRPLDLRARVTTWFHPRADHLFTCPSHRAEFVGALCAWVEDAFPASATPPSRTVNS